MTTQVMAAQAEVERLKGLAAEYEAGVAAKEAELERLRPTYADAFLDGEATEDEVTKRVARLQAEIVTARDIAAGARRRVAEAEQSRLMVYANRFSKLADDEDAATAADETETEALQTKLAEHEGVPFIPEPGVLTRSARRRLHAEELRGKARVCEAAAQGQHVAVDWYTGRGGGMRWETAGVTHADRGVPATTLVSRILAEDGLAEGAPPAA
jgi:hypothetical protein